MANRVVELQNAFQSMVNTLKNNRNILAVFTFGSIVSGDVWDESDIDLFVVYDGEFDILRDVYSDINGVPVHTKVLSRKIFLDLYNCEGNRGFIRNFLIASKLVYSYDKDITSAYNNVRYSVDTNIDRWNLVYLGSLLKDFGICKKYLQNGGLNTSYQILIRVLDSLSKLLLNLNGYSVTKNSLTMATNLDNRYKELVDKLFSEEVSEGNISLAVDYIDTFLDKNIIIASKYLLDYLYCKNEFSSSYEIVNDNKIKDFDIKVEHILKELTKRRIILRDKKVLLDSLGNAIVEENVYASKNINNKGC